jgi:hypothetical protein
VINNQNNIYSPFDALIEHEFINGRWVGYHIDFGFRKLPKTAAERGLQQQIDIAWFYRTFESRLVKASAALKFKARPFLIASPSLPVPRIHEPLTSGGLVVCPGILLVPKSTHFDGRTLGEELEANQVRYLRPKGKLYSIEIVSVLQGAGKFVGELLQNRRTSSDFLSDAILLPHAKRMVQAYHPRNRLILAYDEWIRRYLEGREWRGYLLTFMFNHLDGNRAAVLTQMRQEITWFYGRLLTRIHRRPRPAGAKPYLPLLIAAPDVAVPKQQGKLSIEDVTINDGLHHHAVLLVPVNTRLDHGVDVEVANNEEVYLGRHGKLRHIDVRPITEPEGDVVGYALKQVARDPISVDDILILPKAPSELVPRSELKRG